MKPLGAILLALDVITAHELDCALDLSRRTGVRLGEVLVAMEACTEDDVVRALGLQSGLAAIALDRCVLDVSLAQRAPRTLMHALRAVPLWLVGAQLVVAVAAPLAVADAERLAAEAAVTTVRQRLASEAAVRRGLARLYGALSLST